VSIQVARGDATDDSDIDLLVSTGEETSPWFPAALVGELKRVWGRPVEVVTDEGLYCVLRRRILREARPL
jgi:predicted nucleotidyltransferase